MFSDKSSRGHNFTAVGHSALALVLALGLMIPTGLVYAAGQETIDGVIHVTNGAKAPHIEAVQLEELWTAGGEDDEDVLFGIITKVKLDEDNNLYLLDNQMSQVYVYSPEGELLKTLGHAGEGPGEATNPIELTLLDDGSIGLLKPMPGTLVMLDKDGDPAGNFVPGGGVATEGGLMVATNCYQAGQEFIFGTVQISMNNETLTQTRTYSVSSYGQDTNKQKEYYSKAVVWEFQNNFVMKEIDTDFVWQRMDVAKDGTIVIAPERNKYELNIYNTDGTLERVFSREHKPYEREQSMKDLLDRAFEAALRQLPPGSTYEYEPNEAEVASVRVAGNGDIWIQNSHQQWKPEPNIFAFDIFNKEGEFVKELRFECPGSAKDDRLFFSNDGHVIKVSGFLSAAIAAQGLSGDEEEEAEPMAVTCYKIK